jgi:glycosyltransferase involved in cell wall biosynthesis
MQADAIGIQADRKRKSESEGGASSDNSPQRIRGACEVHSLNTNVSVRKGLDWPLDRCIRELLLNCTDEDADTIVTKENDRTFVFKNTVKPYADDPKRSLRKSSFTYHANTEKVSDRMMNGKFGYGLKDSVVLLTAYGINYVARSSYGSFTAKKDMEGNVFVDINSDECIDSGVQQILSIPDDSELSPTDFENYIERAKDQCIVFRVRSAYRNYEAIEVADQGTVYIPPEGHSAEHHADTTDLFIHGCAYPFSFDGSGRPPLALVYNLHMSKTEIQGRDRANGLPTGWFFALRCLIRDCDAAISRLLALRSKYYDVFYEFGTPVINEYVNKLAIAVRKESELAAAAALRAQENARRAADEQAAAEQIVAGLRDDQAKAVPEETPAVVRNQNGRVLAAAEENLSAATARAHQAQATAMAKEAGAEQVSHSIVPHVLSFQEEVYSANGVVDLRIPSVKDKMWKEGKTPWQEEHRLMSQHSIDPKHLLLFRQLRRLLYALGLQDKVVIDPAADIMAETDCVALRGTALHVRFDAAPSIEDAVHSAVQELCTAGVFPKLTGLSPAAAVAKVASLMLQLTPNDPRELALAVRSSTVVPTYLGEFRTPSARQFCPLLVATEWDTKNGGISSFNIQLAKGLAAELRAVGGEDAGPVVYFMVLGTDEVSDAVRGQWLEARTLGISIVEGSRFQGKYTPCLTPGECARITHIVGHAHITGSEAAQIRALRQLRHAKLWQINHVLPRDADHLKEGGTPQSRDESARKKEALIAKLNEQADRVYSVGTMMFEDYENQLSRAGRERGTEHKLLILPLNPDFTAKPTSKKNFEGDVVRVLYFGRVESVYYLKGMDIAVRAVERANNDKRLDRSGREIKLTLRGTKSGMEAETMNKLLGLQDASARNNRPYVEGFASPADVLKDLHRTDMVIMPSRNEPFGLVAMEAIACRVPVLVSSNSGVARLLKKKGFSELCVKTSAHNQDDATAEADIEEWSNAILQLIADGPRAFERANDLADKLAQLPAPYAEMVAMTD